MPFALECVLHHTRAAMLSGETSDEVRVRDRGRGRG